MVKVGDPKLLMAELERKQQAAEKAAAEKAAKAAARAAEAARAAARALVPPAQMFLPEHDALFERDAPFGGLDADGVPEHDAAGEPLSKSARKKLIKARDKHAKLHAAAAQKA